MTQAINSQTVVYGEGTAVFEKKYTTVKLPGCFLTAAFPGRSKIKPLLNEDEMDKFTTGLVESLLPEGEFSYDEEKQSLSHVIFPIFHVTLKDGNPVWTFKDTAEKYLFYKEFDQSSGFLAWWSLDFQKTE